MIYEATKNNITLAVEALNRSEVVGMPTETVYGLAGNVFDEHALAKIFSIKNRPTFDPLIVHVSKNLSAATGNSMIESLVQLSLVDVSSYSQSSLEIAERLLIEFWPGPFTLVLNKSKKVPDLATAGLNTVAIRMPNHLVAQALIDGAGFPLAAPSANMFGRISPTSAKNVAEELGSKVPIILDGGECEVGLESTVISIDETGEILLLRPGGTQLETIEKTVGARIRKARQGPSQSEKSPGMLPSHYAPRKKMLLVTANADFATSIENFKVGVILFSSADQSLARNVRRLSRVEPIVRALSKAGDTQEAARNLFQQMRYLDASDVDILVAEKCPTNEGLGFAINDRLTRAST